MAQSISVLLMRALLVSGRAFVTPKIRSKTIRANLRTFVLQRGYKGYINVPYYWAFYYHDGRGAVVQRKKNKWLVYYKNPKEDPRLSNGYPRTKRASRKLTKAEFYRDKAAGKLIITKAVGPTRPSKANPFFTEGMVGFPRVANEVVKRNLPLLLQEEFRRRGILRVTVKDTI